MNRSSLPLRRYAAKSSALLIPLSGWFSPAYAQSTLAPPARPALAASSGDTVRLSDEQREAILDKTTAASAAAAPGEMTGSDRAALEVHGEVGAVIGSNGTRAVYGTAAVPLGDHAGAVVSLVSSRFGYWK